MDNKLLLVSALSAAVAPISVFSQKATPEKPNIVLIMVDDMGYSDLGCFGSEIPTPNLDRLAQQGLRYTQFYNTARSCPTRACLLTGIDAHLAGIGQMSEDPKDNLKPTDLRNDEDEPVGYKGYLNRNCVTMAEVLKDAGYHTYMTGKWHVGYYGKDKWPLQRGFERFYGILAGACSYLQPHGGRGLTLDNTQLDPPAAPYYTTDAFTDYAIDFLKENEAKKDDKPFFLYLAYNAPHWPLHAKQEDIDKFIGKYDGGWEKIREARHQKMIKEGIVDKNWGLAEWESRHWNELTPQEQKNSSLRMSVYAAQVHCMDYNVGRLLDYLDKTGERDNTLIVFLSDNGACAEPYSETGFGTIADINDPKSSVAPSYGLPWSQVSNTPFRKYKVRAYEGGISAPVIFSWPARYKKYDGQLRDNLGYLSDIMATFVDASGATYPETYHGGNKIHPLEGYSLLPTVSNPKKEVREYVYGEHFNNCFIRNGKWKAIKDEKSSEWELYDEVNDRAEHNNVAAQNPEVLKKLVAKYDEWADSHNILPKPGKKQAAKQAKK